MKDAPPGKSSAPGTPPKSHRSGKSKKTFKDFIVYSKEKTPDGFATAHVGPSTRGWSEEIGHTHEFGGDAVVTNYLVFKKGKSKGECFSHAGLIKKYGKGGFQFPKSKVTGKRKDVKSMGDETIVRTRKKIKLPKRPFMKPSLVSSASVFGSIAGKIGGQ